MKNSNPTTRNSFSAAFSFILTFGLFCCISLFSASLSQAQSTTFIPINQVAHEIIYPSGTFDTGDSVTLSIQLGNPAAQVQRLLAISLELSMSDNADVPATSQLDFGNSWLGSSLSNTSAVDAANHIFHIDASRSDGAWVSGMGEIASLTLVSNQDGVTASELVNSLDGGITIVDNIEMRILPPAPAKPVTCFPNPFADHLTVEGLESEEAFQIFDATGKVVFTALANDSGWKAIGVQTWPAGIYFLHAENGSRKRIVKQ